MTKKPKKRVAVLGGGCAAMTAAYYLSNTKELQDELEITVYQMGWRLGGKGASGRQQDCHDRILEHGLHVWGGFYYNAFHMMQECYGTLDRPEGAPLRTWEEAFTPHDLVVWQEFVDGRWHTWPIQVPSNNETPGQGDRLPDFWSYLKMLVGWIRDAIEDFPHEDLRKDARDRGKKVGDVGLIGSLFHRMGICLRRLSDASALSLLHRAHGHAEELDEHKEQAGHKHRQGVLDALRAFVAWLRETWSDTIWEHDESRRIYILVELGHAIASGILKDELWNKGWFSIDDEDLADWLRRHGAPERVLETGPVPGFYDYFFAYEDGDTKRPRMSAAMGLVHLLRLIGTYKGSLFWKMESGMGDAVFGPLYELSRRNGVRFRFFHQVDRLVPSADGKTLESVEVLRQVDLKHDEYEPLRDVRGLPSWPSEPLYHQIDDAQAAELKRRKANLEDPWTDWDPVERITLKAGEDYDAVVLGISIGAFPHICRDLMEQREDWRKMVEALKTTQTQALQLWYKPDRSELGWDMGNATGTAYGQPLESWSDMTPVRVRETWPAEEEPGFIVYFCGPQQNPPHMPDRRDPEYGRAETRKAQDNALAWCREYLAHLYRGAAEKEDPSRLRFDLLIDPANGTGEERFRAQYVRSNYTPSERYVLDLPGTNQHRLVADSSGYDNLALAGDWLFTGLGGAVESAVIAGMQAARALGGCNTKIVGEMDSPWAGVISVKKLL